MKKLKIALSRLAIRRAQMPTGTEFNAVKLTCEQAMSFDHCVTWDKLVSRETSNLLKPNEHYEGYIAVLYPWGIDVVCIAGHLQRINPDEAKYYFDADKAKLVMEGKCWTVRYKTSDGDCPGMFNYVWTFKGCHFAKTVEDLKKKGYLPSDTDAEATDKHLKNKLVSALCGNQIVNVTDDEDLILKVYLGKNSYYKSFFSEV